MPPLLAALFMVALGCDLRIVEAIDLGMEWRLDWHRCGFSGRECAEAWYANRLARWAPESRWPISIWAIGQ
jgi:hypothetical protein